MHVGSDDTTGSADVWDKAPILAFYDNWELPLPPLNSSISNRTARTTSAFHCRFRNVRPTPFVNYCQNDNTTDDSTTFFAIAVLPDCKPHTELPNRHFPPPDANHLQKCTYNPIVLQLTDRISFGTLLALTNHSDNKQFHSTHSEWSFRTNNTFRR